MMFVFELEHKESYSYHYDGSTYEYMRLFDNWSIQKINEMTKEVWL